MMKCSYFILFVSCLASNIIAQNSQNKPTILFVGMKHFESFKDIFTPKRQKEVEEVVALLKKFRPTKITCEREYGDEETSELCDKYLKNESALSVHESNQIGFRLAKQLHHQNVYGVDYRHQDRPPSLDSSAKVNNQEEFFMRLNDGFDAVGTPTDTMVKNSSVREVLRAVNAEEFLPKIDMVMLSSMVHIGQGEDYVGTDNLLRWYKRNLRIYTNITRVIDSRNDRVLVLIGAAHVHLLRSFALESGEFITEKADEYLK